MSVQTASNFQFSMGRESGVLIFLLGRLICTTLIFFKIECGIDRIAAQSLIGI